MNKRLTMTLLAPAALALGACSTTSHCTGELDYQKAQSVAPLQGTGTLKVPQTQAALVIPPEPKNPVPFGSEKDGDTQCLDTPPPMPEGKANKPG